ncbi:MAG: chorismate-binding protein, partial [Vicingaceae bacterium]|nr:chorismate-binding protein [Vicingaceae bacterium]
MKITTNTKTFIADTITPVSLYLNLRDKFYNSFLLESSDYHSNENAQSFICLEPRATFKVENQSIIINGLGLNSTTEIKANNQVVQSLQEFINQFKTDRKTINGVFGYTGYDAIQYFDKLSIRENKSENAIPELSYSFYKYIIQINHFKNELTIIENLVDDEESEIDNIEKLVNTTSHPKYHFYIEGEQSSNLTDKDFKDMVTKGKFHCQRGDVFQMVLSRQFSQKFKGDDFNLYRALRSVNPSPYLFYFDFGNYKLFGSSPEAQIKVENGKATINPIAGTFKRTGNDIEDRELAEKLSADPKETSEHNMLVDLA